jgi:hypothetical protein
MKPRTRLIWLVISTTLFVVTAVISFVSDVKSLSEKLHWLPFVVAVMALAGIVTTVSIWIYYERALRDSQSVASEGGTSQVLGPAREGSDFQGKVMQVMQRPGIREIDIGGLALRSPYFRKDGPFSRRLLDLLKTNSHLKVRIWLMDPKSMSLKLREAAEDVVENRLRSTCTETLETLKSIVRKIWKEQGVRRPTVVLVDKVAIMNSIFRVDGEMWVTLYLQHGTGSRSPMVRLEKEDFWFDIYKQQFETCLSMHMGNLYPSQEELEEDSRNTMLTHET